MTVAGLQGLALTTLGFRTLDQVQGSDEDVGHGDNRHRTVPPVTLGFCPPHCVFWSSTV